jgi:hypothetical protein
MPGLEHEIHGLARMDESSETGALKRGVAGDEVHVCGTADECEEAVLDRGGADELDEVEVLKARVRLSVMRPPMDVSMKLALGRAAASCGYPATKQSWVPLQVTGVEIVMVTVVVSV